MRLHPYDGEKITYKKGDRYCIPEGECLTRCEECKAEIPEARRKTVPGVRFCVKCQSEREKMLKNVELYNRRAGKDSQLK